MIERSGSRSFFEDQDRIDDPIFKSKIRIGIGSKTTELDPILFFTPQVLVLNGNVYKFILIKMNIIMCYMACILI